MKSTKIKTIKTLAFTIGLLFLIFLPILNIPSTNNITQNNTKSEMISILETHPP